MINIIKTAIITIIISIISGLLLEHFKSLAPRILCKTGDLKPIKINNKKVYSYSITVSNISNKIIHDLTVNIQNPQGNLKIANSKITKGLKYESSIEDNIIDIDIPYLSKGDKFLIIVYLENEYEAHNKPVIVMRSPENFKQIDSAEKNGMLASLLNKKATTPNVQNGNKKVVPNKKIIVIAVSIVLVLIVVVLGKLYLNQTSANSAKTNDVKQSTDNETGNTYSNTTPEVTNKSTSITPGVTTTNTGANTAPKSTTKGTGTNTLPASTTTNTGTNTPTNSTTKSTDTNTTPGSSTKNTDTNTTPDGTNQNTSTNAASGSTTGNTGTNASQTGNTAK
ncbi:hypothetical protein SAMN02745134_01540 [Clostridium acidisoli DSM 12555]|uniref:Uncharacterized protein n=1 Tax=Clostridium acidisoli DSM 12555 TaxID=1121291 RepID=A0A1W1XEQ4_9CLOT|nr:hypothetical protein [Clostridium acidisoli]SMC22098.1 hypothetical protein SAMN02745134_01540 [Clostridium acidisoli DSM 12555]